METKRLIFIGGAMGCGKTTVGQILNQQLEKCVYLDGDWCWHSSPFTVTEETKEMVVDNITHILKNFLNCSEFENIVFTWVMHEQAIINSLISALGDGYEFFNFSLMCSPPTLRARLEKDIANNIRTPDVIERALARLCAYDRVDSVKINTDDIDAHGAAEIIKARIFNEK